MSEYQCAAVLWSSSPADGERCERPGVIQAPSGKWYCANHTPQQSLKAQAVDPAVGNESTGDKP